MQLQVYSGMPCLGTFGPFVVLSSLFLEDDNFGHLVVLHNSCPHSNHIRSESRDDHKINKLCITLGLVIKAKKNR